MDHEEALQISAVEFSWFMHKVRGRSTGSDWLAILSSLYTMELAAYIFSTSMGRDDEADIDCFVLVHKEALKAALANLKRENV